MTRYRVGYSQHTARPNWNDKREVDVEIGKARALCDRQVALQLYDFIQRHGLFGTSIKVSKLEGLGVSDDAVYSIDLFLDTYVDIDEEAG